MQLILIYIQSSKFLFSKFPSFPRRGARKGGVVKITFQPVRAGWLRSHSSPQGREIILTFSARRALLQKHFCPQGISPNSKLARRAKLLYLTLRRAPLPLRSLQGEVKHLYQAAGLHGTHPF